MLLNICSFAQLGDTVGVISALEDGEDVNSRDSNGETPLSLSTWCGHLEMVHFLLERGADVNTKTRFGNTPLINALYRHKTNIIPTLLEAGADVNTSMNGVTALSLTVMGDNIDALQMLIDFGADVNALNSSGDTALIKAIECGRLHTVILLIKAGADINRKFLVHQGYSPLQTALSIAKQYKHPEIILALEAAGAIDPSE